MRHFFGTVVLAIIFAITPALSSTAAEAKSADVTAQLRLCMDTYRVYWLMWLGEDRDFCDVFATEGDVSVDRGIQWDAITVINSVGNTLSKVERFQDLASELRQCVKTYPKLGRAGLEHPDWCLITPSATTARYFKRAKDDFRNTKARFSLPDVLHAAWLIVKHRGAPHS